MTAIKICHVHETVFMQLQKLNGNAGQRIFFKYNGDMVTQVWCWRLLFCCQACSSPVEGIECEGRCIFPSISFAALHHSVCHSSASRSLSHQFGEYWCICQAWEEWLRMSRCTTGSCSSSMCGERLQLFKPAMAQNACEKR